MLSVEKAQIGNIVGGNYSKFETDGTLVFVGDAIAWEDLRVPVSSTKKGGSKEPVWGKLKDDGAGSQGVFAEWFDKTTEQELFFTTQMSHKYKLGTNIIPHVHWATADTEAGSPKVCWGLELIWADRAGMFGNTTLVYTNTTRSGDTTLLVDKFYASDFAELNGSGITQMSSMLICRIFRDTSGVGLTDDYDDDAGLLEIDFHYQIDTIGSRSSTTK